MWEMLHPAAALADEAMRPLGDAEVRLWPDLQPEYAAMHHNAGDLPNECIFITMNEFLSDHWGGCHVVPSYSVHLLKADHRDAYRFHGRVLRTLQLRGSAQRWVLKAPSHLSQLPALFDVYPDARIIQTHRDPLRSLPSALSLMGTLKWMRCDEVDLAPLAAALPRGFATSFRAQIVQRADGTLPDERFIDVGYHELVADPVAAVAGIYTRLEWEFSHAHAERITRYLSGQSRESRRPHRYSLAEMGLDAAAERERFAFYCDRFGVPAENA